MDKLQFLVLMGYISALTDYLLILTDSQSAARTELV